MSRVDFLLLLASSVGIISALAFTLVRARAFAEPRLSTFRNSHPNPLARDEFIRLKETHRSANRALFAGFAAICLYALLSPVLRFLPPWSHAVPLVALLAYSVVVVRLWFRPRCPRCGLSLGLRPGLAFPQRCERCLVSFRPHLTNNDHGGA